MPRDERHCESYIVGVTSSRNRPVECPRLLCHCWVIYIRIGFLSFSIIKSPFKDANHFHHQVAHQAALATHSHSTFTSAPSECSPPLEILLLSLRSPTSASKSCPLSSQKQIQSTLYTIKSRNSPATTDSISWSTMQDATILCRPSILRLMRSVIYSRQTCTE